jgi:hypothetical protein
VRDNNAVSFGIGADIMNNAGSLALTDSTVAGNTSDFQGGGIYNNQGPIRLRRSVVSRGLDVPCGAPLAPRGRNLRGPDRQQIEHFSIDRRGTPPAPLNAARRDSPNPARRLEETDLDSVRTTTKATSWETAMKGRLLVFSLLAISLAGSSAHAQTPPASPKPEASAVDPGSIKALTNMGAHLLTLKRFRVSTEVSGERVLADGQKLQHSARADLDVVRPAKLRVQMRSARAERELIFDGKKVTLYTPAQKYYSTVDFAGTIGELINVLEDKYGVELPLEDLFLWGTPEAPVDKIESAMNAGQDFIGKDLCDHYAFRQGQLDWQIWITTGDKPLPRKVVISNRGDDARPQSVSVITWNLKPGFADAVFRFTPPAGATKIQMVQRKTQ